jgi:hypothetical protein
MSFYKNQHIMKRKIKFALILLFFITSSIGFSQTDMAVISLNDQNMLYTLYPNEVVIGNNGGYKDYKISSDNIKITKVKGSVNSYLLECEIEGNQQLYFINKATKDTFDIITYRFEPMPRPELYYGATGNGEKINYSYSVWLRVNYNESIPLIAKFDIIDWEISIPEKPIIVKGKGFQLNDQATSFIKNAPVGSDILISCTYSYRGKVNKTSSIFKL